MAEVQWYYARDDEQLGPLPPSELRRLAASGGAGAKGVSPAEFFLESLFTGVAVYRTSCYNYSTMFYTKEFMG